MTTDRLGIIAGNGALPLECARGARAAGVGRIFAVCFPDDTSRDITPLVDDALWIPVGKLGKLIEYFKSNGVARAVMIGQLNPRYTVMSLLGLDLRMTKLLMKLTDRKADTVLRAIARELSADGIELIDSTAYLNHLLAPSGAWGRCAPDAEILEDIRFGFTVAKEMGRVDVGQTVVVKNRAVVAVEAMEGSDACIARGCSIAETGAVVVKVSKPKQDLRFDVPVIGPRTLENLVSGKAAALAVEASKTLVLDREDLVRAADKNKLCLYGVTEQ